MTTKNRRSKAPRRRNKERGIQLPESLDYEITPDGVLKSVPPTHKRSIGRQCHEALFERDVPCEGCPALSGGSSRPTVVMPTGSGPFRVTTVERNGARRLRVRSVSVTEATLSALLQARINRLSDGAKLSPREREVFDLVMLGRSFREIGRVLGIGERTVKFHHANLLEKLGADRREDLLRLVL